MDGVYSKKQNVNNRTTNNIIKKSCSSTNGNVSNVNIYDSTRNDVTNISRSNNDYAENSLYEKPDNSTFNNTNSTYKVIDQYTADVVNNDNQQSSKSNHNVL